MKRKIFSILFALVLVLSLSLVASAAPLPVKNIDTGETFATIQAAIDDTQTLDGHTIIVKSGTYHERVMVHKSVTLIGIGFPVIDADNPGGLWSADGFTINTGNVIIDGFKIVDADDPVCVWVTSDMPNIVIRNNTIDNTEGIADGTTGGTSGIAFTSFGGSWSANGAVVEGNTIDSGGAKNAITFDGTYGTYTIERNKIDNAGNGIMISGVYVKTDWSAGYSRVDLSGTVIRDNKIKKLQSPWANGINLMYVDGPVTITGNQVKDAWGGIVVGSGYWDGHFGTTDSYCTAIAAQSNDLKHTTYAFYVVR